MPPLAGSPIRESKDWQNTLKFFFTFLLLIYQVPFTILAYSAPVFSFLLLSCGEVFVFYLFVFLEFNLICALELHVSYDTEQYIYEP